jgi:hypothetical protein
VCRGAKNRKEKREKRRDETRMLAFPYLVLRSHDVADAQIGQHNGGDVEDAGVRRQVFLHDGRVVGHRVLEFRLLQCYIAHKMI